MAFDFDSEEAKEVDVSSVVDAIRASSQLAPLTEQQKLNRRIAQEIAREEREWKEEQRRAERDRQEQEAQAIARHEAAVALAEANRQLRLKQQRRDLEQNRDLRLGSLEIRAKQGEIFQAHVEAAARNAVAIRQQQALLVDVEKFLTPPPPAPEPEPTAAADDGLGSPYFFDDNYNPNFYRDKLRGKFRG